MVGEGACHVVEVVVLGVGEAGRFEVDEPGRTDAGHSVELAGGEAGAASGDGQQRAGGTRLAAQAQRVGEQGAGRPRVHGDPDCAVAAVGLGGGLGDVLQVAVLQRVAQDDGLLAGHQVGGEQGPGDLADGDVADGEVGLPAEDGGDVGGGHRAERVGGQLGVVDRDTVEELDAVDGDAAGCGERGHHQRPDRRFRGDSLAHRAPCGLDFGADVAAQRGVGALDDQADGPDRLDDVGDEVGRLLGGQVAAVEVGDDDVVLVGDRAHVLGSHGGHSHPGARETCTGGGRAGEIVCHDEDLDHGGAPRCQSCFMGRSTPT
ncbi:hypothetical protein NOGI109294_06845 [Nocardiopsis gilva]